MLPCSRKTITLSRFLGNRLHVRFYRPTVLQKAPLHGEQASQGSIPVVEELPYSVLSGSSSRNPLEPSSESLSHRARIAYLVSPLRRVKPRVPFFELAAHRIPTLYGLYRGLLRYSPDFRISWRIRKLFEKNRGLTGTAKTKTRLERGYKYLETFKAAAEGDLHLQAVLKRYASLIEAKREKEMGKQRLREELAWQHRLLTRPRLTGGLRQATLDNKPLPVLKPQPDHFSGMFVKRRAARERRLSRKRDAHEDILHLETEAKFEAGLGVSSSTSDPTWTEPLRAIISDIDAAYARGIARAATPISPELYNTLRKARKYKIANKTRERQRERSGEYTNRTLRRMRQGPPAHLLRVWKSMGEKGEGLRVQDAIRRRSSVGGWTGRQKGKLGMSVEGGSWEKEDFISEQGRKIEQAVLAEENARRRRQK